MLDIKFIRENPDIVKNALAAKNVDFDLDKFLSLDDERRALIKKIDELRNRKNVANDEVKNIIKDKGNAGPKIEKMREISNELDNLEKGFKDIKNNFDRDILRIPNIPHFSVPKGGVSNNKIVKERGEFRNFGFKPATHIDISDYLGIIDFKRASKICGANFSLFKAKGAFLVRALINFMLDVHTKEHNYIEIWPPYIVNRASMTATGQLPKLEDDMYRLKDEDYFLIPTAEVPITNMHRSEVIDEDNLPVSYVGYTACFRREAGSYGKGTRGLVRVHQFDKVELVKIVKPQGSYDELESLLADACSIIERLQIPYRVVMLAEGDLSFAAAKCYDIEIYAPGINKWLEVSSCSNFEDFQARRGSIKYKDKKTGRLNFVHTLNGSGVALARLIIAILENYQQKDGTVEIPKVLRRYFDGEERIKK
ncbi:MAG: serine--tRNA ligase [Candidatus Omnitrophica bacterium 4484_171]|nr:MAG: serine--tRNA ligase [Candidatus Omnitrophica bacterium 4484_171]